MEPTEAALPRFAFLVHPLVGWHRRVIGVRQLRLGLAAGYRDGTSAWDVGPICELELAGVARGVMVSVPMVPDQLLGDQERVLQRLLRAVELGREGGPLAAVGLGALCAVVAGRGTALGERLDIPVTTGAAATAWTLAENTLAVLQHRGAGAVGVVGSAGVVGRAVTTRLVEAGISVRIDSKRGGKGLDVEVCKSPEDTVRGCSVVVGAGPTGASVSAEALMRGAVVVDVAIPGTVRGRLPRGVRVLAGEAMSLPAGWTRGGWGHLFHVLAGYGPGQVFACLVEPLILAAQGRREPFAQGRSLTREALHDFGEAAKSLGFHPRLARGWRKVEPGHLSG